MAKLLPPLLLLCLLLCGCGRQDANIPPTDPMPHSAGNLSGGAIPIVGTAEDRYNGAMRIFPLGIPNVTGIRAMGSSLVVFSGSDTTTLTLLSGRDPVYETSIQLDCPLDPNDPSLRFEESELSYYDPIRRLTIVLDASLQEISHIAAPEQLQGQPLLSADGTVLYYCTPEGLHAWDLRSGLHRRIKEMSFPGQHLTGLFLDDSVLQCQLPGEKQERTVLLSAQTGQQLHSQSSPLLLTNHGGCYCVSFPDGLGQTRLYGEIGTSPQLFLPADAKCDCFFLARQSSAVTISISPEGGSKLDYYSLSSGLRLSTLLLESQYIPTAIVDTSDGRLLILAKNTQDNGHILCRWDISPGNALAVSDSSRYVFPYYRAGDIPDDAALSQCQAYAQQLSETYGIEILIDADAVRVQPWDYALKPETQPAVLRRELELLDARLAQFPRQMLIDTASHFSSLKLCIVRQLVGTAESGSLAQSTGAQFFSGTDAYMVIASGPYAEQATYHELFHVMETHILTNSGALDQWDTLNPQAFSYSYHALPPEQDSEAYLTGENQAFVDAYSMTFPREDRARILEYAMLPGNQALFQPWILQRKLSTICAGIREAYGLQKSQEPYPWEQYLYASLAPKQ